MSNRTVQPQQPLTHLQLDDLVRGAVERALESRLTALTSGLSGVEGRVALADQRLSALDQRVSALSLPEQLTVLAQVKSAIETHLREGVRQLEWFATMAAKVRELYADANDMMTPTSDGLPTVSDLTAALTGGAPNSKVAAAPAGLEGVPPEVASVLSQLFNPTKK